MTEQDATRWICATRAIKNARHIQEHAPDVLPAVEPIEGFSSIIPFDVLSRIHISKESHISKEGLRDMDANLAEKLMNLEFPIVGTNVVDPLFNGVLIIVRLIVAVRNTNSVFLLNDADISTVLNYTFKATGPISQYAAQYGRNQIAVQTVSRPFFVELDDNRYSDSQLRTWVNEIGFPGACVVVLNPPGLTNTDGDPAKGIGGYHSKANVPYIFANVSGQNFTLADERFQYAGTLSHEIAEMTVDPLVDGGNPEVCDPCGPNCVSTYLDYFNSSGAYIATSQQFPPSFNYAFFINGIVASSFATQCPAPAKACNYAPGFPPPAEKGDKDNKDRKDRKDHKETKERAKEKDLKDSEGVDPGLGDQMRQIAIQLQALASRLDDTGSDEAFIQPDERPEVG